jgi:hypothetical protein
LAGIPRDRLPPRDPHLPAARPPLRPLGLAIRPRYTGAAREP